MIFNRLNLLLAAVTALSLTMSCSKSDRSAPGTDPADANKVNILVTGCFKDFCTKADVENVLRMTWSSGTVDPVVYDSVYVYGMARGAGVFSCLGKLGAVPVEGTGNSVADLRGRITAPVPHTKITLVYSPLLTAAPSVFGDGIGIDMAEQDGGKDRATFVAFSAVDYVGTAGAEYRALFDFATSIIRVNISGMDVARVLTKARIDSIETVCRLTFSAAEAPSVSGTDRDVIVRSFPDTVTTDDKGRVAFYMAVPAFTEDGGRGLRVSEKDGSTYLFQKFVTRADSGGGGMINSIAAIPVPAEYVVMKGAAAISYGCGTFIPETGVYWAPVDCGYDSDDYKSGRLYQFGRTDGCGYHQDGGVTNPPQDSQDKVVQSFEKLGAAPYYTSRPLFDRFYGNPSEATCDWYTSDPKEQMTVWPEETGGGTGIGNPCPAGWRVPTRDELNALLGGAAKSGVGGFQTDGRESSPTKGLHGLFFNGTSDKHPSSGVFLLAAGYRNFIDGSFWRRGTTGSYWSSSPSPSEPTMAGYLNFNESEASMNAGGARANGFSVRCVHD